MTSKKFVLECKSLLVLLAVLQLPCVVVASPGKGTKEPKGMTLFSSISYIAFLKDENALKDLYLFSRRSVGCTSQPSQSEEKKSTY